MTVTQVRNVADVWSSSVDKHTVDGEIPVQLCNYTDAYKNDTVAPHPGLMRATATPEELRRFRLHEGDTVLTKDSEDPFDIGISAFITGTSDDFVCGYHLAVARPRSGTHPRFLNWALRSWTALSHFSSHASGISRYGLGITDLRATPVPVHAFEEQRRIAEFLDDRIARIDKVITLRQKQSRVLRDGYESWLHTTLEAAGAEHGFAPLRRFGVRIEQGWSPLAEPTPAGEAEAGILKLGAIRAGQFRPVENKAMLPGSEPQVAYLVEAGDLLVTRANTPQLVGDVAVARGEWGPDLYLSDLIYRLRIESLDHDYASAALRSPRSRQLIGVVARGTSGSMPKLRGQDLLALPIPRLPRQEQAGFGAEDIRQREARHDRRGQLGESIRVLQEYKQSLITSVVTGELDVTTAGSGIPG